MKRLKKVSRKQDSEATEDRLLTLLSELKGEGKYLKRLTVKDRGKIIFVGVEEIDFIEAQGNYLELDLGEIKHLIRMRLHQLESKLSPDQFVRIHRSTIVNIDRIKEMHPLFNGDQTIVMKSGKKLTMTRNYRDRLKALLGDL